MFVIEAIVGKRETEETTEYLIKWQGYDQSNNEWRDARKLYENIHLLVRYETEVAVREMKESKSSANEVENSPPQSASHEGDGSRPHAPRNCALCRKERSLLQILQGCLSESAWLQTVLDIEVSDFRASLHRLHVDTPASLADCTNIQIRIIAYYKLFNAIYGPHRGHRRDRKLLPICCVGVIRNRWPGGSHIAELDAVGLSQASRTDSDSDATSDAGGSANDSCSEGGMRDVHDSDDQKSDISDWSASNESDGSESSFDSIESNDWNPDTDVMD